MLKSDEIVNELQKTEKLYDNESAITSKKNEELEIQIKEFDHEQDKRFEMHEQGLLEPLLQKDQEIDNLKHYITKSSFVGDTNTAQRNDKEIITEENQMKNSDNKPYLVSKKMNLRNLLITSLLDDSDLELSSEEELYDVSLQKFKKRHCVKNYWEEVVPSYTEKEFIRHFRISKGLFNSLIEKFTESQEYLKLQRAKAIVAGKHLAIFLWFAGHEAASFRDIADRFNVSLSSVCLIIRRCMVFISNLSPHVIKWPNNVERERSTNFFKISKNFEGVVGNTYTSCIYPVSVIAIYIF